jgi:phospho-N-acetylmuramoyl-pentapeptide-transferase
MTTSKYLKKQGLKEFFKVFGQVGLGLIVGAVLYFSPAVTVRTDTGKGCFRVTTENVVTVSPVEEKIQPPRYLSLK